MWGHSVCVGITTFGKHYTEFWPFLYLWEKIIIVSLITGNFIFFRLTDVYTVGLWSGGVSEWLWTEEGVEGRSSPWSFLQTEDPTTDLSSPPLTSRTLTSLFSSPVSSLHLSWDLLWESVGTSTGTLHQGDRSYFPGDLSWSLFNFPDLFDGGSKTMETWVKNQDTWDTLNLILWTWIHFQDLSIKSLKVPTPNIRFSF